MQQRLDDYRGDFVVVLFKPARERIGAINAASGALPSDWAAETMRGGHTPHGKSEFLKRGDKIGICSNRHGSGSIAMVGVFQSHEFIFAQLAEIAPKLQRHLQRHFDGSRAVIRKKDVPERLRQDAPQAPGEFLSRIVRKSGEDHMFEFPSLFGNGLGNQRMRMPVEIDPPG